jgi:hypothetical protein
LSGVAPSCGGELDIGHQLSAISYQQSGSLPLAES